MVVSAVGEGVASGSVVGVETGGVDGSDRAEGMKLPPGEDGKETGEDVSDGDNTGVDVGCMFGRPDGSEGIGGNDGSEGMLMLMLEESITIARSQRAASSSYIVKDLPHSISPDKREPFPMWQS